MIRTEQSSKNTDPDFDYKILQEGLPFVSWLACYSSGFTMTI